MKRTTFAKSLSGLALLLTACGPVGQTASPSLAVAPHHGATVKSAESIGISWPVSLGTGYAPINHLATDPTRPGVWFTTWNQTEESAYFYDPTSKTLSSWPLGSTQGADGLDPYADLGLAVDSQGNLWLGAIDQLVELDPSSGAVSRWTIPTPTVDTYAPADLQSTHDVDSLAIDGSGRVIIGMTATAELEMFDPSSKSFSNLALPSIGEIQSVAALQDGTVAVAMADEQEQPGQFDRVVLIAPNGTQSTVAASSGFVVGNGTSFLAGFSSSQETISESGSQAPVAIASPGTDISPTTGTSPLRIEPDMGALEANGNAVLGTTVGIAVVSSTGTEYVDLPTVSCPGVAVPVLPTAAPTSLPSTCQVSPVAIAVDGAGNIWIAPNLPQYEVGLIPAGSY